MRFLLVNPFCPVSEGITPPLGLSFLAASLEKSGVDVEMVDFSITRFSPEKIKSIIETFKPSAVGLTAVSMTFYEAIRIAKEVKRLDPAITTVMGGPHVSFCAAETLSDYPEIDLIVIGEGEETIVEIAQEMDGKRHWSRIKGLAFRSQDRIVTTHARPFIDVNTLPIPARHLLPLGKYRTLNAPINMTTSRGCPYKCIFCIGRKMVGSKVRYRNPQLVVNELESLSQLDFPQINIADDLFTSNKHHCLNVCHGIIERGIKIKWSSFARVDTVTPDVLTAMRNAGCSAISFGVETANKQILKTIKKGITLPKVVEAIKACKGAGIEPHVSFIIGLPGESPESLAETREFGETLKKLGASYGYHLLAPFPGTTIRDRSEQYDLKILSNDWSTYHANRAITETRQVNKQQMDRIAESWEQGVVENLARMQTKIAAGNATADETFQIFNLNRFVFLYELMINDIIEELPEYPVLDALSDDTAVSMLSDDISTRTGKSKEECRDFLGNAFERNGLRYEYNNGRITWYWTEKIQF